MTRNLSGERGIKSITVSHKSGLSEGNVAQVVSRNHMGKNVVKVDVVIEERVCERAFIGVTTRNGARKHASKAQESGRGPPTTSVSWC